MVVMRWRAVVSWVFFPILLAGGMALAVLLQRAGVSDYLTVFGITFLGSLPILVLQRLMPYEETWRGRPVDFSVDLVHVALSNALPASIVRALAYGAVVMASNSVAVTLGGAIWPQTWPMAIQLPLAILVGDLGSYWMHRSCHKNPMLWRIHALHHSSERMYVLASVRNHPLNVVLTFVSRTIPLVLLGADPEVLALVSVFNALLGMLQHSNIDMHTGAFGWIVSTPELHRWHHSTDLRESGSNFGTDLAVWDIVFGTRFLPRDRQPVAVGLPGTRIPTNYWQQLAVPFVLERFAVPAPVLLPIAAEQVGLSVEPAPPRVDSGD
jgi:sterol desaturase/sphingolipid hydroxylase (fatty acid hydroxylase superfamily)